MKRLFRRYVDLARERNAVRRPRSYGIDSDQWVTVRADAVREGDTIRVASIATARVTSVTTRAWDSDAWLWPIVTNPRDAIVVRGLVGSSKYVQYFNPDSQVEVIRA